MNKNEPGFRTVVLTAYPLKSNCWMSSEATKPVPPTTQAFFMIAVVVARWSQFGTMKKKRVCLSRKRGRRFRVYLISNWRRRINGSSNGWELEGEHVMICVCGSTYFLWTRTKGLCDISVFLFHFLFFWVKFLFVFWKEDWSKGLFGWT